MSREDAAPGRDYRGDIAARDRDLESSYSYSREVASLSRHESTIATVAEHAMHLAEMFWQSRDGFAAPDPREALLMFEARHFGRQLEPAAHGILTREVVAMQAGRRGRRGHELFTGPAEEQHWRNCSAEAMEYGKGECMEFIERVVDLATGRTLATGRRV